MWQKLRVLCVAGGHEDEEYSISRFRFEEKWWSKKKGLIIKVSAHLPPSGELALSLRLLSGTKKEVSLCLLVCLQSGVSMCIWAGAVCALMTPLNGPVLCAGSSHTKLWTHSKLCGACNVDCIPCQAVGLCRRQVDQCGQDPVSTSSHPSAVCRHRQGGPCSEAAAGQAKVPGKSMVFQGVLASHPSQPCAEPASNLPSIKLSHGNNLCDAELMYNGLLQYLWLCIYGLGRARDPSGLSFGSGYVKQQTLRPSPCAPSECKVRVSSADPG